jgi:hypothetical protein
MEAPKRVRKLYQARHQEVLEEDDREQDDHGRKVDPHPLKGNPPPDKGHQWFRNLVDKTDDRVVGIGMDPGEDRPDENDPHVEGQRDVDDTGDGGYEISEDKHGFF